MYGTITVGGLIAAETARAETYATTVGAVLVTMAIYWLADSYAQLTGERLRSGGPLSLGRLLAAMRHELAILAGAAIPLIMLLVCWAGGVALSTALNAAVWSTAVVIVGTQLVAGLRTGLPRRELIAQTLFGALLGFLIIVLRALLH